jgi:hypothetical protein
MGPDKEARRRHNTAGMRVLRAGKTRAESSGAEGIGVPGEAERSAGCRHLTVMRSGAVCLDIFYDPRLRPVVL